MHTLFHIVFQTAFVPALVLYAIAIWWQADLIRTHATGRYVAGLRLTTGPTRIRRLSIATFWAQILAGYIALTSVVYALPRRQGMSSGWATWSFLFIFFVVFAPNYILNWNHNRRLAPLPPPAWFADPQDSGRERWWNGNDWSGVYRHDGRVFAMPPQVKPPLSHEQFAPPAVTRGD